MERNIRLAVILLLLISVVFSQDHRYCLLDSCPNRTHTLCQYQEAGAVPNCGRIIRYGLPSNEIRTIISLYNYDRPITLHQTDIFGNPSIESIMAATADFPVQWDLELAEIAQRWADQCIHEEDRCRNVDRFHVKQRVGQDTCRVRRGNPSIYSMVSRWSFEDNRSLCIVPNCTAYRPEILGIDGTMPRGPQYYGKIGCGAITTSDDIWNSIHLVCNLEIPEEINQANQLRSQLQIQEEIEEEFPEESQDNSD